MFGSGCYTTGKVDVSGFCKNACAAGRMYDSAFLGYNASSGCDTISPYAGITSGSGYGSAIDNNISTLVTTTAENSSRLGCCRRNIGIDSKSSIHSSKTCICRVGFRNTIES